ncbi:hypothetical protein SALBM217S_08062 [Streptomyces griseoloalbus]
MGRPDAWWEAYLSRVVPPVLAAFHRHGVVLEAHLQNTLIAFDADGLRVQALFRDAEGVKLLPSPAPPRRAALRWHGGRVGAAATAWSSATAWRSSPSSPTATPASSTGRRSAPNWTAATCTRSTPW